MTEGQLPAIRLYKFISPGLLKTMGNQLVAGRDFTWADTTRNGLSPWSPRIWRASCGAIRRRQSASACGETLKTPWHEIIGVVGDEHDDGLNQKAPSIVCGRS